MENKVYTEYDNECMIYLSLQIMKSSYFKDKWCYIDIYYEEIKKIYKDYKKEDDSNVSLLDSINNFLNKHEEEIKERLENAFDGAF